MQSNKFIKIAKNIAKKDKELFDSLIEFEKTHRIKSKTRLNFTIDKNTASQFRKYCREHGYNMSAKIEQTMNETISNK